jgi:predicted transcriptional regulator
VRDHLSAARKQMVAQIPDEKLTFRGLRLAAGLSQRALADIAGDGTTQSYIARIEGGSLDPGTDLIVRLASALSVDSSIVFRAILQQRTGESRG